MIGEVIAEFKGKTTGTRFLGDGKIEGSYAGSGNLFGKEASIMATAVFSLMPNGVNMIDGNGMVMTAEGESVMHKFDGIGLSTGKGWQSSNRGAVYFMTNSPKLMSLNKIVGVWEWETSENGDFSVKVWEWK
ncbi:hypothetical protein MUP77_23715 [Candidatus Bathyarchaeota archaeon]|nr:hypothetical protein [Candidatus Bathyarchaeota archaeon]